MSSKLQINLEDVIEAWKIRKLWNTASLNNIELLFKGAVILEDAKILVNGEKDVCTRDEWIYRGLNNVDYMLMIAEQVDETFEGINSFTSDSYK